MDFVLLHARGPERHACCANMTGLATKLRMAASRLESGHGMGAAAWKRVELQEELHSGAGPPQLRQSALTPSSLRLALALGLSSDERRHARWLLVLLPLLQRAVRRPYGACAGAATST